MKNLMKLIFSTALNDKEKMNQEYEEMKIKNEEFRKEHQKEMKAMKARIGEKRKEREKHFSFLRK